MTYKSKLLINFTALFAVFTLLLVMFQYNREKQYKRDLLEARLRSYANVVAGAVSADRAERDSTGFADLTHLLPSDLRLTVIGHRGEVLYESKEHGIHELGNHLDRPEVQMAEDRPEGEGVNIRSSATFGQEFFYFAKDYHAFIVRVALPYNAEVQNFMKADNVFLWFVLMLFPIALVLLIYISDHFGKAVTGLRNFMNSADRGLVDYEHIRFPDSELGKLGEKVMQKYQQLELSSQQIALERERLLRHFHYFEEGIGIFDPERHCIYANPRLMQYANVVLDHPTANIDALWQSEHLTPVLEFLQLHGGTRCVTEEAPVFRYNVRSGGSTFAVQALIYSDGSFELTLTDVTQAEKNRVLKQQMSNNITHELRTPVSSIRGYIETIIDCPTLSDERKHYFLEKAHAQVVRLTDLIRDVALITKTEEAADLMPREAVNVARVVNDVREDLQTALEGQRMKLFTQIADDASINGNYTLVYSIFRNLLENSIRYAGEGTEVHVNCYNMTAEYCYFSVYDTGQGVPEEHLPRLFERFYRVTEGRTRANGGTGLGLSIVRNAVLFHHGDISVRNRKGAGLEFLFTLHC